ncbi:MAG: FixH family protein [Dehalococcoidia bacterium]|nr:FixH family protein [Dehalococcoidia bacterium]
MPVRHTTLIRPACIVVALVAIVVSIALTLPQVARAQSDERFQPLFNREVGPFNVGMSWVPPSPQVGIINIGVKPAMLSDGSPVTDARITLVAESEPDHPEFEVVAVNTPNDPEVYRANLKFEEAGNWVVQVKIDSPTVGQADFRSPLVILPAPIEPGVGGAWVFLGIFLVLTAGSVYIVMAIRRSQAARRMRLEGRL